MPLTPGDRLGPYEIVCAIGEGGMGQVFKATDTRLARTVAIKTSRAAFNERFEREARAVAALNHPHICTLYDVGPDYLVMEYIEGQPVKGPLPLEDALRVAIDIADALDAAHRHGIVHRDLKPGNILITKGGVKLFDFGLAKFTAAKTTPADATLTQPITAEGSITGTLQYMAPEQLQGKEADARGDVFSFGCVLYELLGGRRAFGAKDSASVIAAILKEEPAPIAAAGVLPKSLDRCLRKCLKKDPDQRWQSAADLRDELKWIADGGAPDSPTAVPARKNVRAWFPWIAVTACAALAAAALLIGRTRPAEQPAVQIPLMLSEAADGAFSLSPDGRNLLYRRNDELVNMNLERGQVSPVKLPLADLGVLSWLPDSRGLLWQSGRRVSKMDLADGVSTNVAEIDGFLRSSAPVGFFAASPRGLFFFPTSGEPRQLADMQTGETLSSYVDPLPDNRHLLVLRGQTAGGPGELDFVSLDGASAKQLTKIDNFPIYAEPGYLLYLRGDSLVAQKMNASKGQLEGSPQPIVEGVGRYPGNSYLSTFSVSQNGRLAFRHGSRYPQMTLTWFDRAGRKTSEVGEPADYSNPALSPDEKRLAVSLRDVQSGNRIIWIYDLERGSRTRLTFDEGDVTNPDWSPDGARLAYSVTGKTTRDLYIRNADGSGEQQLLLSSSTPKAAESWSPDGRFLSFIHQAPGNSDLYFLPMDTPGKTPVVFRATPYTEQNSNFSPDSRLLAYRSNESGRPEVFVQPLAPNSGRQQISTNGGDEPSWRADGKELFYVAADDFLMAVDIQRNGDAVHAGTPHNLFPLTHIVGRRNRYVATHDGQRFLAVTALPDKKQEPVMLVLNWPALLQKK